MSSTHVRSVGAAAALTALTLLASAPTGHAKPITTTKATYPRGAQIAARGSVLAVARIDAGGSATLLIGSGEAAPEPALGAGPLPRWAQPHVGTDAAGGSVVVYPRCSGRAVATCDLYAWDVAAAAEIRLGGVSAKTQGETEGVFDRGTLAFNRWIGTAQPTVLFDGRQVDEPTTLYVKAAGGSVVKLAAKGGRQLALRGPWLAQVRDTTDRSSGGICGVSTVELVNIGSPTVKPVRSTTCGLNGSRSVTPAFAGDSLLFGVSENTDPGMLFRYPLKTGKVSMVRAHRRFEAFAATRTNAGWSLHPKLGATAEDTTYDLERWTGLLIAPTGS